LCTNTNYLYILSTLSLFADEIRKSSSDMDFLFSQLYSASLSDCFVHSGTIVILIYWNYRYYDVFKLDDTILLLFV